MRCDQELPACPWQTHGVTFDTNLKVLSLGCYDVILGIDWLAQYSPMKVHWLEKTMDFDYKGDTVHLQGARANINQCHQLSSDELTELLQRSGVARMVQLYAAEQG